MEFLHYPVVDSTNLEARRLWKTRIAEGVPFAVVADEQTAGIGRQGRVWHSPHGGLWISVVWPARKPLAYYEGFPLASGLAVAETIESIFKLHCRIKWPNDILVNKRKLSGILCQSESGESATCVVIGIGVNGNFPASQLGGGDSLRHPATTISDEIDAHADMALLRAELLRHLEEVLEEYEVNQMARLVGRVRPRLAWLGEQIKACGVDGNKEVAGRLAGIDEAGRLLLETDSGVRSFLSGELERISRSDLK